MIKEIMGISSRIHEHRPELWDLVQKSAGNGGSAQLSKLLVEFDHLHALFHQIQDMGIEIKDPITGLIDFVCLYDGREVYLCWKYGEESIEFWHEIEAGFSGRKLIDWE